MSVSTHLFFLFCVALATFTQSLTGFAFSLILLGLIGVSELVPIADAANAASVLVLVNAFVYFRHRKPVPVWSVLKPALATSSVGVLAGVALLSWLSGNAVEWLRALLGAAILACALLLLIQARPLQQRSSTASFLFFGSLSGIMGGLFASSGPPMVYHLYRQPFEQETIRQCLLWIFAANAAMRLVLVCGIGGFSRLSVMLALEAIPTVFLVTRWQARHPLRVDKRVIQRIVSALLVLAGAALIVSAARRLALV